MDKAIDTRPNIILKSPDDLRVTPHLRDYDAERACFSWEQARGEIHNETGRLDEVFRAITLPDTVKAA